MARFGIPLAVVSSGALVAGLLVGVVPVAQAASPVPAAPAIPAAPATDGAASADSAVERRGQKVVDLRDGTCARTVPLGLVRFDGPGDTQLTARVRAQGEAKLLTIVSGSGRIGENVVRAKDVSGELTWRKGAMTGSVTIKLPEHVKVSRTWAQDVTVNAQPNGCDWAATVMLQARGEGATLDLRGPLADSGSYVLRGSGSVSISRTSVPVTGFLRATTPGRSASTTWRVTGSTPRLVRIPGARLSGVKVSLGNVVPIVRGTASVRLDVPLLTAPAVLEVAGANTWSAQVNGSNRRAWIVPQTDQVVVRTSELRGSVGMRAGQPHWTLTAPGAARIGTLDYSVDVGFEGRLSYTVQARGAVGTFLGMPEQRPFLGVPTKLTITPQGITGALTVVTRGEILLDMPSVWRGTTDYILKPVPGEGWTFAPSISHALRAGKGTIRLTGPVSETGGVDLIGSGTLDISGTTVPTRGFYTRSSFTDGSAPVWAMAAYLDEAPGGRIPLDGGAGLVGGTLVFNGTGVQPISTIPDTVPAVSEGNARIAVAASGTVSPADSSGTTTVPVTTTGTTTVQLSDADDDTFYLPVTYSYTDPNNWTATAAGTTPSNVYNPFTGLEIPETDFSGTITDTNGEQTWNVSIAMQDWQEMAKGLDYKGAFTISDECPLSNQDNCPDSDGIFIGGASTMLFDDPSFPTATGDGAFLTDLSWGWWDATAQGSVSVNGVTMANPDVTIWRGSGTGPNPEIVMPDLSDLNGNGMNVEFCAEFTVPVPYVTTVNTLGCAEWTEQGSILAQVNTGGSVATGDYNGVTVKSTTLTGYVWNGLDSEETVFLDGVEIAAEPDRSYLTADIVVPGNAMRDFGTGSSSDTVIAANGWFDTEGNFDIEGTIPVNLKGGGFTLEEIVISIGREKENAQSTFDLRFDAESDVVINGNHFPLDAYIGYQKAGDTTITVGLSATGAQSTQPEGTMDFVNLVPSGDFEPENASLVDGSFDGKLPANIFDDGGFERSTNPGDVVVNGGFDDSLGLNVLPDGDFESGAFGNMLANAGFEDNNLLVNGDFEENGGSLWGWTYTNQPFTIQAGSAVGPDDTGNFVGKLMNPSLDNNTSKGPWQYIQMVNLNGANAEWSMWVTSATSGSASLQMQMTGLNCSSFTQYKNTQTISPSGWVEMSVGGAFGAGCNGLLLSLIVANINTGVLLDAGEVTLTPTSATAMPTVWRPSVAGTFDSLSTSPIMPGYSSTSIASDVPGTLQTNGKSAWMTTSSVGSSSGSFDVSYSVMFPTGTSSREIADFGFWLDGNYSTMNGYCFRLQTSNGDGGFFKCSKTTKTFKGSAYAPDVVRGTWYQVRITSTGQTTTAYVTNKVTGDLFFTDTIYLSGQTPYGGHFGQVPDGVSTSQGIRWDDLTYYWLENANLSSPGTAQPAVVWLDAGTARTGSGALSLYSNSISGQPFQYSTGEAPVTGGTYTYTAWVRAASGSVNGTLTLGATGSTASADQVAAKSFSVGTTWTPISVTSYITGSGYTDLRPGLTMTTTNAELYVDDQVLQQVPWLSNTGSSIIEVTSDEAHGGTNSLEVINPSNSDLSNAFYGFPQMPAPGSVVTATAWVKSPAGVLGYLFLSEGANTQVSTPFTGTGTWQQVTVSRTMQGNASLPNVGVDILSGYAGQSLYVDDVSVTVADVSSGQIGSLGAPSGPAGWLSSTNVLPTNVVPASSSRVKPRSSDPTAPSSITATVNGGTVSLSWAKASSAYGIWYYKVETTSGVVVCNYVYTTSCSVNGLTAGNYAFQVKAYNILGQGGGWSPASNVVSVYQNVAPVIVDDPALAHSAPGALVMQPGPGGTEVNTYTVTPQTAPAAGSTWNASVWIASRTANNAQPVTVTVSAGSSSQSTRVTLPSAALQYTNVVLELPVASAASSFTVQISYTDASGTSPIYVDDVSITEVGLATVDNWLTYTPDPNGFVGVEGIGDDPANAQSGEGYVIFSNKSSQSSAVYFDNANYKPKPGTEHEMSFWVRSPSGTVGAVNAWVRTQDANGNILDSYPYGFAATTTWQQIILSVPITSTAGTVLRNEIDLPPGATIWVDNIESRDINYWSAVQPSGGKTSLTIEDNAADPANGQNYLRFVTSGAGGGMGDTITADVDGDPIQVVAGSSYKLEAYVRSTTGATVSGTMTLGAANGSTATDSASVPFTVGGDWTPVQLTLDTTKNANTLIPRVVLNSGGQLDVDELTLVPVIIEQSDPWSAAGSGVTWNVMDDPANAYDSSYGVMEFSVSSAGTGVEYSASHSTAVGDQLSATAFVRTGGANASGTFVVTSTGGTRETWQQAFTADSEWQTLSIPVTVAQSGHTGFTVQVLSNTPGTTLYLDQVALQTNPWTPNSGVSQAIVFDGAAAQSGSGYLRLTPTSSNGGSTYIDMAASSDIGGTYAAGTTWQAMVHLKSTSDASLATGRISLGVAGGTSTAQEFSVGSEWTAVPVSFTVGSSAVSSLRVTVSVNGSSVPVEVDSVTISDGTPPPDGVTTPLPHPEHGWVYLWDDAFGVPGLHLWAVSAQVDFEDGEPGLGVSATVYQDPTKASKVMSGTDWMKGDMAVNISYTDPCFLFDFSSDGGNSGVSLGQGVFTAKDFSINFAPRGCQVGLETLPKGASLSFDGQLGDGTVNFDIAIEDGDDGPEFTEDIGITDITIGGFDFKEMELSILLSETNDSITFAGDMVLPMGNFSNSFDLSASESGLVMDGSVSVTDWQWTGGGFDVEEFAFDMSMTVPFGAGECGSFSADTSGQMDMAKKTSLSFTGDLAMNCGTLDVLELDYDYHHGAVTEVFELKYDSATGILAGDVEFDFERSTSWKFLTHRYNRHPKFDIKLAYSMDVANPGSAAMATLTGDVSVSGGDGSLSCTIEAGSGANWADDQCSLHVHISIGGGHTYNASW